MRTIHNPNRYISTVLIAQLFDKVGITHVDKVVCGNGFTTAFLKLEPIKGKVDILIFPNVKAIQSKELAYAKGDYGHKRIGFIYGDSDNKIFGHNQTLCFVLDSFKLRRKQLEGINIGRILVDEYHTVTQQASFRYSLIAFERYMKEHYSNKSILTVTASPNHFDKVDVRIHNSYIPYTEIMITNQMAETVKRIRTHLERGEKVVVFTTDKDVLMSLRDEDGSLDCNLLAGSSLQRRLVGAAVIKHNPESLLTVISSNGFEGLDLYGKFHVFFFEVRYKVHRTFMISNIYQAINRARDGAESIEYCRIEKKKEKEIVSKESIIKHIENTRISNEQKQATKHKELNKYIHYDINHDGTFTPVFLESLYNLEVEEQMFDKSIYSFESFLKDRNITIKDMRSRSDKVIRPKISLLEKQLFYSKNEYYIKTNKLAGEEFTLDTNPSIECDNDKYRITMLNRLMSYLALKVYDTENIGTRELLPYEQKAVKILESEKLFNGLIARVKNSYSAYYRKKLTGNELKEKLKRLDEKEFKYYITELILSFTNSRVYMRRNRIGHRDYNVSVMVNLESIDIVATALGRKVFEHDIKTAFVRIAYMVAGLELPPDFYGADKKNKIKINAMLNNLHINKSERCDRAKENKVKSGTKIGIDERVMNLLVDKFAYSDFKGDFFNFAAYYERIIIRLQANYYESIATSGYFRRHDSLIYIDLPRDKIDVIKRESEAFKYKEIGGWFQYSQDTTIDPLDFWSEI